jgi:glycosyltransferase involved in cell wall biosynthesis
MTMPTETFKKPVRVCFVCFRSYPLFNPAVRETFGGAEVDLYRIATELAKDPQFTVSTVVGDYGQPAVEVMDGVTLIRSIDDDHNLFLQAGKIWKAMARADADVYFAESMSLGMVLYSYFCRRKSRAFMYRTASSRECDGTYFHRKPFRSLAVRWALQNVRALITQNNGDARNLKVQTGLDAAVIRNAYPIPPAIGDSGTMRDTILWVGRSDPIKQPELFLDLAASLPEEQFTMICSKYLHDRHYESLRERASQIANLAFIDGVPYREIDGYFTRAKMLVNTSSSEGFPNTFVQACLQATPIVSLCADPDNFLGIYQCGLCAEGNRVRFLEMIRQLLDPATAKCMGQNGRNYAKKYHNLEDILRQYKAIVKHITGRSVEKNFGGDGERRGGED